MNRLTSLLLLVVVIGLGIVIWFQTEREDPTPQVVELPLFEGLDVKRLTRIRIDHLDRAIHISIDRDSGGRWFLTDPIAYPVRRELLVQLMDSLARNRAWIVPDSELEAMDEALARPRAVLELTEQLADGSEHVRRLEMGPVDIDGMRINVRVVDGDSRELRRTWRDLETTLQTSVTEWRSRAVFDIPYDRVREVRREGFDPQPDGPVELGLTARSDGRGWWIERPLRLRGDPGFLQMWSGVLTAARVRRFHSDVQDPDLASYGLDPPAFTLTLVDRDGREETLEVGKPLAATPYFCRRSDGPHVWELEERDMAQLFLDVSELFDSVLVRVPREAMETVRLRGPEWDLRLTHALADDSWTCAWKRVAGEEDWTTELPAARATVDRVLAAIGRPDSVAAYLWDSPPEQVFPEDAPLHALWVSSGGVRHGGRIGPPFTTEAGTPAYTFWRERETAVCLVPPEIGELLELTPEDFISLQLVELSEPTLRRIEISADGRPARVFRKTVQTTWIHDDLETDALPELLPVIEHLFYLVAASHVPREDTAELADPVTVRIQGRDGWTQFEVGRTAEGQARAQVGSRQSVLKHQPLHADLWRIATGGR